MDCCNNHSYILHIVNNFGVLVMKKIFLVIGLIVIPILIFSDFISSATNATLILFPNFGVVVTKVNDGEIIPENWEVLSADASWYVKLYETNEKIKFLDLEKINGELEFKNNVFYSKDGKKYKLIGNKLVEIVEDYKKVKKIFFDTDYSTVTFRINGGFKFSYILNGNKIYQFLNIHADIDDAFVIAVSEPNSNRGYYEKAYLSLSSNETNFQGKKIFVLGNVENLKNNKHILYDKFSVEREDYNFVSVNSYNFVEDWRPCQRVVFIKSPKQLPAGDIQVWSNVSGINVPIDYAQINDVEKETEIHLGPSWENWYKWKLETSINLGNKRKVSGNLYLKGYGNYKIKITGKNISNLKTNATIIEKTPVYVLLFANNTSTINIEYEEDRN